MRPRSCTMTVRCIYFAPITGYSRFTRNYCTHRPDAMLPGNVKENDPAVDWHGLQRMPNHPNNGGRRLLARVSVTGLEVPVMRIPYKSGFLPTGPLWCCNSCKRRRTDTGQRTRLGWTRKWLQRTFPSNGRKLGLTDVCSSRSAIIGMAPGRATSGCLQAPLKLTGYSCQLSNTLPRYLR